MFHHFNNEVNPKAQGAISATEFEKILCHVDLDRILPAAEFFKDSQDGTLQESNLCLTFDDVLLCQ